jgi:hypothetical protein
MQLQMVGVIEEWLSEVDYTNKEELGLYNP